MCVSGSVGTPERCDAVVNNCDVVGEVGHRSLI